METCSDCGEPLRIDNNGDNSCPRCEGELFMPLVGKTIKKIIIKEEMKNPSVEQEDEVVVPE